MTDAARPTGWQIAVACMRPLWRHAGVAVILSFVPLFADRAFGMFVGWLYGLPLDSLLRGTSIRVAAEEAGLSPGRSLMPQLWVLAFGLFCSAYVAISWHRFILIEDRPSLTSKTTFQDVSPVRFIGWLLLLSVPLLVGFLAVLIVPVTIFTLVTGQSARESPIVLYLTAPCLAFGFWLSFRLSLVLPAMAIGRKLRLRESWRFTGPVAWPLFVPSIVLVALYFLAGAIFDLILPNGTPSETVFWLWSVVPALYGISILTTLYAHLVEGRPLD